MEVEKEALQLVQETLSSIDVVMQDWKKTDNETKTKFSSRVDRLKKWKNILEKWKQDFIVAPEESKYNLLIQLHDLAGKIA